MFFICKDDVINTMIYQNRITKTKSLWKILYVDKVSCLYTCGMYAFRWNLIASQTSESYVARLFARCESLEIEL